MFDSFSEYLASFKNKLFEAFNDSFTVASLKEKVKLHYFDLSAEIKDSEAKVDGKYEWVAPLSLVLEKIMSIVSNPRTHIKSYKDIKNVDTAPRIDNKDIAQTIKVPRLWKPINNEMLPEYVYCDNYDMEIAIYENRFLISLIDLLNFFLLLSIQELYTKVKYLRRNYSSKIQLGLMDGDNNPLTLTDDACALLLRKVIDYKKKLSIVFSSNFYREVKKSKPLAYTDIHATNLLLGDASYSVCFAFYRKYLTAFHKNEKETKKNKIIYYDYVLISLILELDKIGFAFSDENISIDENAIKEETIHAKNKDFELTINKKENQIILNFEYIHKDYNDNSSDCLSKKYVSSISLDIFHTYPSEVIDDNEMNKIFNDTLNIRHNEGFDNAYIITSIDMIAPNEVIYLSPMNEKLDSNIKSLLSSLLLIIRGDEFIYSHVCPICGAQITPKQFNGENTCPICLSRYSMFKQKNDTNNLSLIWIKKVNNKAN